MFSKPRVQGTLPGASRMTAPAATSPNKKRKRAASEIKQPAKWARKGDAPAVPAKKFPDTSAPIIKGIGELPPADPDFDFMAARIRPETILSWCRPSFDAETDLDPSKPFDFQIVSCEAAYVKGKSNRFSKWSGKGQVPVFRLYGVTSEGRSVCINVWNFAPYLFVNAPRDRPIGSADQAAAIADELQRGIERFLKRERKKKYANTYGSYDNIDDDRDDVNLNGDYDDADHPDADLVFTNVVLDPEEGLNEETETKRRQDYAKRKRASSHVDGMPGGSDWINANDVTASLFKDDMDVDLPFASPQGRPGANKTDKNAFAPESNPLVIGVGAERYRIAEHFQPEPVTVFRVGLRTPNLIAMVRDAIGDGADSGFCFGKGLSIRGPTYESGVRFENRFMLDHEVVGTGWVTLRAGSYQLREENAYESRCAIEIDVDTDDVIGHTPTSNPEIYNKPSGFRALSYDIECVSKTGAFPIATRDPVTNIHAVVWEIDRPDILIADVAFVLGSASAVGNSSNTVTVCFENECDLLNAFGAFRIFTDPDIITGYNIANFDERFLVERSEVVGAMKFSACTRSATHAIKGRVEMRISKNFGNSESWTGHNEGRVYIDMLYYCRNNMMQKLRSYTLNAVSAEVLNDQKEDVDHKQIPILFNGDRESRKRLADYCRKDALLPRALMIKLNALVALFEQTRVQRVQLDQQQNGGASFKVFAQLLPHFRKAGFIVPYRRDLEKTDYQGATVLEPERGFYRDEPVGVEDFGSLYPSIAVAHNMCITVHVLDKDVAKAMAHFGFGEPHRLAVEKLQQAKQLAVGKCTTPESKQEWERVIQACATEVKRVETEVIYRCPAGHAYLLKKHQEGIFPRMLLELLTLRAAAKKLVASATTALEKNVRTQREVALKVSANSGYGFHGLPSNGVYWWWIAESITARGRQQIEISKRMIEAKFTKANGYPADAKVIYGDTDSVMILFGCKIKDTKNQEEVLAAIAKVMELSQEAADYCTAAFEKPNTLNFENVYFPYLLISKKRYGGQMWMKPAPGKPIVPMPKMKIKGLESVRRDNCRHVARTQEHCLNLILRDVDPEKAMRFAQSQIRQLLEGKVDLHDLVISGQLSKYQKDYKTPQAHAHVRELMEKRNPGSGPKIGDRVPYVLISRDKKAKRYECAEDPVYAMEHTLPINTSYYIEKQMFKPLYRVFKSIYKNAESQLKTGEHTRHVVKHISLEKGNMASFFTQRTEVCKECGISLTKETSCHAQGLLCSQCEPKRIEAYGEAMKTLRQHQQSYARVWTNCQDCQGSRFKEVICTAQDCPVFYKRMTLKRDLVQARTIVDKLGDAPTPEALAVHLEQLHLKIPRRQQQPQPITPLDDEDDTASIELVPIDW